MLCNCRGVKPWGAITEFMGRTVFVAAADLSDETMEEWHEAGEIRGSSIEIVRPESFNVKYLQRGKGTSLLLDAISPHHLLAISEIVGELGDIRLPEGLLLPDENWPEIPRNEDMFVHSYSESMVWLWDYMAYGSIEQCRYY